MSVMFYFLLADAKTIVRNGDILSNATGIIIDPDYPSKEAQLTAWYSKRGSPTFSISGMVHFRSKALERTILNIF